MRQTVFFFGLWVAGTVFPVLAAPSPKPQDLMPAAMEVSIPTPLGATRGSYQNLVFGAVLFDSGPNPLEETTPGEVRQWVFQAAGGVLTVGSATYKATCIRASRINVLTPNQEFYYQFRVSALEGSCTEVAEKRTVELIFLMDDFIVGKFKSGSLRFFGQSSDLQLFPTLLRAPERVDAVKTPAGLYLGGKLPEVPFVAQPQLEIILRPAGQTSCRQTTVEVDCPPPAGKKCQSQRAFNPDEDPYSSVLVRPLSNGKWGTSFSHPGGAICMRLVGGGWQSGITTAGFQK